MLHRTRIIVRNNESLNQEIQNEKEIKSLTKFSECLRKLYRISHKQTSLSNLRLKNNLSEKIIKLLPNINEEWKKMLNLYDIDNLLDNPIDYLENKLSFIDAKVATLQNNIGTRKKVKYNDMIQSMYMEDARRCMRWYILPNTTPECSLDPNEFVNSYGKNWMENKIVDLKKNLNWTKY